MLPKAPTPIKAASVAFKVAPKVAGRVKFNAWLVVFRATNPNQQDSYLSHQGILTHHIDEAARFSHGFAEETVRLFGGSPLAECVEVPK